MAQSRRRWRRQFIPFCESRLLDYHHISFILIKDRSKFKEVLLWQFHGHGLDHHRCLVDLYRSIHLLPYNSINRLRANHSLHLLSKRSTIFILVCYILRISAIILILFMAAILCRHPFLFTKVITLLRGSIQTMNMIFVLWL